MLPPGLASSLTSSVQSRVCTLIPYVSRRTLVNRAALRPVPEQRTGPISTPSDFLKSIGRDSDSKFQIESWEAFWAADGQAMKKAGVSVRDRRYILWCMEKFRSGMKIQDFAHEPKPKKTVRGWGPTVQNGKRIRSRRHKDSK